MARKTTTRKPASRKRKPVKKGAGGSRAGRMGWVIALAIGCGWAASDGRVVSYVGSVLAPDSMMTAGISPRPAPERRTDAQPVFEDDPTVAATPRMRPEEKAAGPARARQDESAQRTASITPSPAPRLAPMASPRDRVRAPPSTTRDPVAAAIRASDDSIAPPRADVRPSVSEAPQRAMTSAPAAPTGGERHATRRLDVRADPDETGRIVARIDTGSMVRVVKSEGRWRYVESRASAARGWVDGTFLAGESAPAPQTLAARVFGSVAQEAPPTGQASQPATRRMMSAPIPPEALPGPAR